MSNTDNERPMPDALDTDKPERKAMSQESEVTKWTEEQRKAAESVLEPFGHMRADCIGFGPLCAEIARVAPLFASAPPADARLREAVIEECALIALHPYGDAVRAYGTDQPLAVGAKIAAAIRALRSSPAPLSPGSWQWHHDWQAELLARDGTMCEQHPGVEWPHEDCAGPGVPWMVVGKEAICHALADHALKMMQEFPAPLSPSKGARETPIRAVAGTSKVCKACGCRWKAHADGTLQLFDAEQKPCVRCDNAPNPPLRAEEPDDLDAQQPDGYDTIASMLPSILASGSERCPLCGQQGVHEHTPAEILIYRNGVKYGRSLTGFSPPALKSAAPERPAMAVEAAVSELMERYGFRATHREDDWAFMAARVTLLRHFTPAAASPTVKMPEREALGLALLKASGLWHGISADRVAKEFARPGATRNGALAQADAALAEFQRLNPPASPQDGKERA